MKREQPLYLTFEHAATLAGYSMRHFRRLVDEDHLPVMEMRGKLFLLTATVDAFRKSHRNTARVE